MVCKIEHAEFTFKKDMKLKDAIEQMKTGKHLVAPSINTKDLEVVYAGGALAGMHAAKLEKTLVELQESDVLDKESKQTWMITDKSIKTKMIGVITLE